MELLGARRTRMLLGAVLFAVAISGCTSKDNSLDLADLAMMPKATCDGETVKTDFDKDGSALISVNGNPEHTGAIIQVTRHDDSIKVGVFGDTEGVMPLDVQKDGFTRPIAITDGPETIVFGSGGAWQLDAGSQSVSVHGWCDGL